MYLTRIHEFDHAAAIIRFCFLWVKSLTGKYSNLHPLAYIHQSDVFPVSQNIKNVSLFLCNKFLLKDKLKAFDDFKNKQQKCMK